MEASGTTPQLTSEATASARVMSNNAVEDVEMSTFVVTTATVHAHSQLDLPRDDSPHLSPVL